MSVPLHLVNSGTIVEVLPPHYYAGMAAPVLSVNGNYIILDTTGWPCMANQISVVASQITLGDNQ
jgi:hypothetical protein